MKKLFFICLTVSFTSACFGQSPYSEVSLNQKNDFKSAETYVLKAANYLFSSKYDKDDLERLYAIEFVIKWMTGTSDYQFDLSEKFSKAFAGETDLMGLYMAGMVKYTLDNKSNSFSPSVIGLNAVRLVLKYSNNAANNLKQTGEIKRMASALKKGELEKYFGI